MTLSWKRPSSQAKHRALRVTRNVGHQKTVNKYYNDIRDDLEELYFSSTSFVKLYNESYHNKKSISFHLDLKSEKSKNDYKRLCYFYEDSYNWEEVPLLFIEKADKEHITWNYDENTSKSLSIDDGLDYFDSYTQELIINKTAQPEAWTYAKDAGQN